MSKRLIIKFVENSDSPLIIKYLVVEYEELRKLLDNKVDRIWVNLLVKTTAGYDEFGYDKVNVIEFFQRYASSLRNRLPIYFFNGVLTEEEFKELYRDLLGFNREAFEEILKRDKDIAENIKIKNKKEA